MKSKAAAPYLCHQDLAGKPSVQRNTDSLYQKDHTCSILAKHLNFRTRCKSQILQMPDHFIFSTKLRDLTFLANAIMLPPLACGTIILLNENEYHLRFYYIQRICYCQLTFLKYIACLLRTFINIINFFHLCGCKPMAQVEIFQKFAMTNVFSRSLQKRRAYMLTRTAGKYRSF